MHYKLTQEEQEIINALNSAHRNVLMIICNYGDGPVVSCEDIEKPIFAEYRRVLGTELDPSRVVNKPKPGEEVQ